MPKLYSTAIAVKLLVQNWKQELFFIESHNFYLTMVFIYVSWRINILQMPFSISVLVEIFLSSTRVEVYM